MRILLAGSTLFQAELSALGHEVMSIGMTPDCNVRIKREQLDAEFLVHDLAKNFSPNVIFQSETLGGARFIIKNLDRVSLPKVYYAIDCHLNAYWQREYGRWFDLVLVSQFAQVAEFQATCRQVEFFPWSYSPELFYAGKDERPIDITFVGTLDPVYRRKRSEIIKRIERRFSLKLFAASEKSRLSEQEMADVFRSARIVLNESVYGEVNYRYFEAMACGALLVTESIGKPGTALFQDGVHLAYYGPHNIEEVVCYYLEHESARKQIAASGMEECRAKHTRSVRALELSQHLGLLAHESSVRGKNALGLGKTWLYLMRRRLSPPEWSYQEASLSFQIALEHDPTCYDALLYHGIVQAELGNIASASDLFRKAGVVHGGDPRAAFYLGVLCFQQKMVEQAKKALLLSAKCRTNFFQHYGERWTALLSDTETFNSEFYFLAGKLFEDARFDLAIGFIDFSASNFPLFAFDCYKLSLKLDPKNGETYLALAELYFRHKLFDQAMLAFEEAIRLGKQEKETFERFYLSAYHAYALPSEVVSSVS